MRAEIPFVLGLTGSIGMGKSEAAKMFAAHGMPVFDADAEVHALYAPGGALTKRLAEAFPGSVKETGVDRVRLSAMLQAEPEGFRRLEDLVHPILARRMKAFLISAQRADEKIAMLDIPLLYEAGWDSYVDAVVVVSTSEAEQRRRVMNRRGMSAEKFAAILARQMPDAEKRLLADYVVDSSGSFDDTRAQINEIVALVRARLNGTEK